MILLMCGNVQCKYYSDTMCLLFYDIDTMCDITNILLIYRNIN